MKAIAPSPTRYRGVADGGLDVIALSSRSSDSESAATWNPWAKNQRRARMDSSLAPEAGEA
jgi:hypothetical protein